MDFLNIYGTALRPPHVAILSKIKNQKKIYKRSKIVYKRRYVKKNNNNPNKVEAMPSMRLTDINDLSKSELGEWLEKHGEASYRGEQILKWIHKGQVDDFSEMTNLKKEFRALLQSHFSINRLKLKKTETSTDGSKKFLFELKDGHGVESVLIPGKNRHTLCISTQAGCAQGCAFCHTGRGGLKRNLTASEIVGQVRDVKNRPDVPLNFTNIVVMGMGEPLANYDNVVNALDIIIDPISGLQFASRKVTLSTSGMVSKMKDLGRDTSVNLAISLNAADNKTRSMLMPVNRRHPIEELMAACRSYELAPRRRITFEYILIQGVNDSPADALALARLLSGMRAKINLIPFNPFPGTDFQRPDKTAIDRFRNILVEQNLTAITRQSMGADISAACGQLSAQTESRPAGDAAPFSSDPPKGS